MCSNRFFWAWVADLAFTPLVVLLAIETVVWITQPEAWGLLFWFWFGLFAAFAASVYGFIFSAPYIAHWLKTTVERPNHIPFLPLFTDLEKGRAKLVIDTGDDLRRCIMNYKGHVFKGQLEGFDLEADDYWDVVPIPESGLTDEQKRRCSNARNSWEQSVEKASGLLFVGIYPWRKILHYPITITKVIANKETGEREIHVKREKDRDYNVGSVTDHVRVREFDWGIPVVVVMKGFARLKMLLAARLSSVNPEKTVYGVDRWFNSYDNAAVNQSIQEVQGMSPQDVMNADAETKTRLARRIARINDNLTGEFEIGGDGKRKQDEDGQPILRTDNGTRDLWGLNTIQIQIVSYEVFDPTEQAALTAPFIAAQNKLAAVIDYAAEAEGQANVVGQRAEQIKKYAEFGLAASQHEAIENSAKDGRGDVNWFANMGGGSGNTETSEQTTLLRAILAKLNSNGGNSR